MAGYNGNGAATPAMPVIEDKLPPHNLDAEAAVLGSILIDPDCLLELTPFLRPEDFYRMAHRWVYEALVAMAERGEPVDFLTVASEMTRRGQLAEIGGEPALVQMINEVPTSVNAEHYGRLVADAGQRRRMIDAAGRVAKLAYDEDLPVDEMVSRAESAVFAASAGLAYETVQTAAMAMGHLYDVTMDRHANPDRLVGLPTGLLDLDRILGGFKRSDMITLAARPGMGKTALALGTALHTAHRLGKRVALFNLEMSAEQLTRRLVAIEADLPYGDIEKGHLGPAEMERFTRAIGELSRDRLWIDATSGLSLPQIASRCRRLYAEYGLDLIIIDYIGLIQTATGEKFFSSNDRISAISQGVKRLASELDTPVLALSQLNRGVEARSDKRPMLADLRDSGAIEQDSDVVIFIYRDDYYNPETSDRPNVAEIIVAKHRNGQTGDAEAFWHAPRAAFKNLEKRGITL